MTEPRRLTDPVRVTDPVRPTGVARGGLYDPTMEARRWIGRIVLVVVVALPAACGGSTTPPGTGAPSGLASTAQATSATTAAPSLPPEPTPASTPAPTPGMTTTGALPASLDHTFAARVDPSVVAAPDEAGDWFLTLTSASGYGFGRVSTGLVDNPGDLAVAGSHLTFSGELGPGACGPTGEYAWAITSGRLVLSVVADDCAVRVSQYVHQPWIPCPGDPTTCASVLP